MRIPIGNWEIRSWEYGDVGSIVRYANNPNVSMNLRDAFPHPYSVEDAKTWLQFATVQSPETHFAIASPQEAIGGIGFYLQSDIFRRSAEIGYWLGEPFWGKGIATEALRALTAYAFANFDLVRIYAGVFEGNDASCRVLEKAGYSLESRARRSVIKTGQIKDQFIYVRLRW